MTTNTAARSLIASAELDRINADLNAALEDVALLERLRSAADRVARLTAEQAKAVKARDKAVATATKARDEARFAGISDVRVQDKTPEQNVVRSLFEITYVRPKWDGFQTRPMDQSANGFGTLCPNVLDYLIERCPDRIPAKIMALAPDNPREAFRSYFVSVRRGYVAA